MEIEFTKEKFSRNDESNNENEVESN